MATGAESTKQIVDYLDKNMKKGYKIEDLRWALVNQKHSRIEIEKAIKIVESRTPIIKKEPISQAEQIEEIKYEMSMPEKKQGFFSKLFGRN